jgi:hypothetical protein
MKKSNVMTKDIFKAYMEINNSKYKVGDVLYNIRTGYAGPIQRVSHSGGVLYYHGNNPCREDDLSNIFSRKKFKF